MSDGLILDHYPFKQATPRGWSVTVIEEIASEVGSGFPCGAHNSEGRGVPHVRPMNIDREGRFDLSAVKYVDGEVARMLRKGDVLFNNTNSPELIGKTTDIAVDTRLAYSNHMTRITLERGMNARFVAKQLHYLWMSGYFRHRCKNHVNQASIASEPLSKTVPLLVAPEYEQSRIADALDELLSDLDAGVKALESVRAKLRQHRAAVLKAAVEGTLTAEWRKAHPDIEPASELLKRILVERRRRWEEAQIKKHKDSRKEPPRNWKAKYAEPVTPDTSKLPLLPKGWYWASVDQVCDVQSGLQKSPNRKPVQKHYPYLRVANVRRGYLDLETVERFELADDELSRLRLRAGDLLIVEGNGSRTEIGRSAMWKGEIQDCIHQNHIIRARPLPGVAPKYADNFLNSPTGQTAIQLVASSTSGLYTLSVSKIERVALALPPPSEQDAIVELVEEQLSVIDHLESDLEAKLKSAQALRQTILKAAFEGKLVSQHPNDEPATELLKRIAVERAERERLAKQAKKLAKPTRVRGPKRRQDVNAIGTS